MIIILAMIWFVKYWLPIKATESQRSIFEGLDDVLDDHFAWFVRRWFLGMMLLGLVFFLLQGVEVYYSALVVDACPGPFSEASVDMFSYWSDVVFWVWVLWGII